MKFILQVFAFHPSIGFILPCLLFLFEIQAFGQQTVEPAMLSTQNGNFKFTYTAADASYPLNIFYCRPKKLEVSTRIIFVMHGSNPDTVKQVCDIAGSYSEKFGAIIVAPQFSTEYFPGDSYMFGNMLNEKGTLLRKEKWGFSIVEQIFDALREGLKLTDSTYDIVGFSGGGQFVQRMVLFMPEARFRRAVAGSPGRYALPTFANRFPYGLQNSPITNSDLPKIFGKDFILLLGDADTVDRIREDQAQEQGSNRFARGLRFFAIATEEASNVGTSLRWRIQILHNIDHDPATVVSKALDLLE